MLAQPESRFSTLDLCIAFAERWHFSTRTKISSLQSGMSICAGQERKTLPYIYDLQLSGPITARYSDSWMKLSSVLIGASISNRCERSPNPAKYQYPINNDGDGLFQYRFFKARRCMTCRNKMPSSRSLRNIVHIMKGMYIVSWALLLLPGYV